MASLTRWTHSQNPGPERGHPWPGLGRKESLERRRCRRGSGSGARCPGHSFLPVGPALGRSGGSWELQLGVLRWDLEFPVPLGCVHLNVRTSDFLKYQPHLCGDHPPPINRAALPQSLTPPWTQACGVSRLLPASSQQLGRKLDELCA